MFGLSQEDMARIREGRPRPVRRLRITRVVPIVLLAILGTVPVVILQVLNRPAEIQSWVDRFSGAADFRLRIEDVEFLPMGRWTDPWSWQLAVTGLAFAPVDPKKPSWRVSRGEMALPRPRRVQGGRWWLHWPSLLVDGLAIEAHQQRPPPPWEPKRPPVAGLSADTVRVRRARYSAPEDPPLGAADMQGIEGDLTDLLFDPGRREVSAKGSLHARSFLTGAIQLSDIDAPYFELDHSTLKFDGTFLFAGTEGTVAGTIHTFHVKPRVAIRATLSDADVTDVVQTATGRSSPVGGRLDLDLSVEAGGDRPRGCARMTGEVEWRQGRIKLDPRTRYLILDLIRVAPWVKLNAYHEIELSDAKGLVTLTRGTFTLRGLQYPFGRRPVHLDGTINTDALWLLVRLIPRVAEDERVGLAVAVEGDRKRQKVRLANRDDVFRPTPWLPPGWETTGGPPGGLPCGTFTIQ